MSKYQSIDFIKSKILVSHMLFYWHKKIIQKQQMGWIKKKCSSSCRTTNHCKQPQATPSDRLLKRPCVEAHRTAWGCSTSSQGHSYTWVIIWADGWGKFNREKGIFFYTVYYPWKRKICFKGRPWTAWNIAFFPLVISAELAGQGRLPFLVPAVGIWIYKGFGDTSSLFSSLFQDYVL